MIGTILQNRYEIVEKIGEGGMAEVYKAKDNILNRFVTIKILKSNLYKDVDFIKNFRKEAMAVAGLSHNNVVKVYDIVENNELIYIVMEYIDGKDLKRIIKERGSIDYEEALKITLQIARALEHAHKNYIIHRDIKSQNILISNEGIVKVTDFGIAKVPSQDTITSSEKIIGSAHYISPEQAKGQVVDKQSDLYSLGVVLYEMIVGKLPFNAESAVTLAIKHIQDKAVSPNNIKADIPDSVNDLIVKLLEKEKYNRYGSASELVNDINNIFVNIDYKIEKMGSEEEKTRVIPVIKADKPSIIDDNKSDEMDSNNKKRNFIIIGTIIAAIITFSLSYFAGTGKLSFKDSKKVELVEVPSLTGMTKEGAEQAINSMGLKMLPIEVTSTEKINSVIQCYPYEGSKFNKNLFSTVKVLISRGTTSTTVPKLVNINYEAAKYLLEENGLSLGEVKYIDSKSYTKDSIISQSIKPDIQVDSKTSIDLVVSSGSEIKYVKTPQLIGESYDDADKILRDSSLKLGNRNEIITNDIDLDKKIATQSIQKNVELEIDSKVDIAYYTYKPIIVKVPNLIGMTIEEALYLVEEVGLSLNYQGELDNIIVSQNYLSDTEVEKGKEIVVESEIVIDESYIEEDGNNQKDDEEDDVIDYAPSDESESESITD